MESECDWWAVSTFALGMAWNCNSNPLIIVYLIMENLSSILTDWLVIRCQMVLLALTLWYRRIYISHSDANQMLAADAAVIRVRTLWLTQNTENAFRGPLINASSRPDRSNRSKHWNWTSTRITTKFYCYFRKNVLRKMHTRDYLFGCITLWRPGQFVYGWKCLATSLMSFHTK